MISSAIIPQPLARLPWRLIWLVALICTIGIVTLYSAAGGSMSPWALKQGVTMVAFALLAVAISYVPENFIKQMTFPAYVVILILGHVMVTYALWLEEVFAPPFWVHVATTIPLTLVFALVLLQPVKGAIVALQWRMGMHGFRISKEKRDAKNA